MHRLFNCIILVFALALFTSCSKETPTPEEPASPVTTAQETTPSPDEPDTTLAKHIEPEVSQTDVTKQAQEILTPSEKAAPTQAQDNWPRFRGADGTGVAKDNPALPEVWGKEKNIQWVNKIPGLGWSSPIVWGNKVLSHQHTATRNKRSRRKDFWE